MPFIPAQNIAPTVPQEALVYLGVVLGLVFGLILFGLYLYRLLCFAHTPGLRCFETKPTVPARPTTGGKAFDVAANSSSASVRRGVGGAPGCSGESVRLLKLNDNGPRGGNESSDSECEQFPISKQLDQRQKNDLPPVGTARQQCQNVNEFVNLNYKDTPVGCRSVASSRLEAVRQPQSPHKAVNAEAPSTAAWLEVTIGHQCHNGASQGSLEIGVLRAAGILTMSLEDFSANCDGNEGQEGPVSAQVFAVLLAADRGGAVVADGGGRRLRSRSVGIGVSSGGVSVFHDTLSFDAVQCADLPFLTLQLRLYTCPYLVSRRHLLAISCLSPPALKTANICQTDSAINNSGVIRLTLTASADQPAWDSDTGFSETSSIGAAIRPHENHCVDELEAVSLASEPVEDEAAAAAMAAATAAESLSSLMGQAELFTGLTYSPLTGQLAIEILKGSGLRPQNSSGKPPDTLVKLCLESASTGQAMFRCKTSCATGTPHPMWKENFVFPVNKFQLVDVSAFLCVFAKKPILSRLELIGWAALGRKSSGEEERAHWQDMLDAGGSQVCRWHRLLTASSYTGPKP